MAPVRKKSRGGAAPASGASGVAVPDAALPSSMNMLGPVQKDVSLCVELMYSLRHGLQSKRPLEEMEGSSEPSSGVPTPGDDGAYPFPILSGGTFMEVAQRAQTDESGWLLVESAAMCHAAGLVETADPHEFKQRFVTADVALA